VFFGSRNFGSPPRTFPVRRYLLVFAMVVSEALILAPAGNAQRNKPEEYQVKAVYLFNFGKFIEWPTNGNKPEAFTICVLGRDPFGPVLDATIAGEAIDNQKFTAKRIENSRNAMECQILFVSSSESGHAKDILTALHDSAILTVSDMPEFANNGGMIQFVMLDNKVRFEVNLAAAEKAGLTMSSQLLKVATEIKRGAGGETVKPQ